MSWLNKNSKSVLHHQILKALCLSVLVMFCLGFARPTSAALISCDENAKDSQGQPVGVGTVEENWIRVQVPIPGVTANCQDDQGFVRAYIQDLGAYIAGIYRWFSGAIGVFATVMIFYGGIVWLTAGGNRSRVQSAKEVIFSSLIAVVIALGSYLLLYTISPNLVNLRPPALKVASPISQQFVEFTGFCDYNIPTQRSTNGKDVPCGQAVIVEAGDDQNPPKACMGYYCEPGVLGNEICQVNRNQSFKLVSGSCRSEFIGVDANDTTKQYNISTAALEVHIGDTCGIIRRNITDSGYTIASNCSGHYGCIMYGSRIEMVDFADLIGYGRNVACSDKPI